MAFEPKASPSERRDCWHFHYDKVLPARETNSTKLRLPTLIACPIRRSRPTDAVCVVKRPDARHLPDDTRRARPNRRSARSRGSRRSGQRPRTRRKASQRRPPSRLPCCLTGQTDPIGPSRALSGLAFADKKSCLPIAAADLLAYRAWGQEVGQKPIGILKTPSKSDVSYRTNVARVDLNRDCSSSDNLRLIRGIGREALAHQG